MVYVVLSTDASGERTIDEADSLDAALQHVERLRNEDGVSDVRVLREVPIEVKTYYKVVAVEEEAASAAPAAATAPPAPPAPEPAANGSAATELTVTAHEEDVADVADATSEARPQADGVGADFFTPPPVRSHETDEGEADGDAVPATPSERRTSLFGRG